MRSNVNFKWSAQGLLKHSVSWARSHRREKKDISFVYFLAKVLDGMSADHSVDVSGGLSITGEAGPLDPTAIYVGETARRTEAWQELPFKSALNKNMQPIHKEKQKQRSLLVFMFCCKTSRKSNKPEMSFPVSTIYLHP
jgi:hypothetical protein